MPLQVWRRAPPFRGRFLSRVPSAARDRCSRATPFSGAARRRCSRAPSRARGASDGVPRAVTSAGRGRDATGDDASPDADRTWREVRAHGARRSARAGLRRTPRARRSSRGWHGRRRHSRRRRGTRTQKRTSGAYPLIRNRSLVPSLADWPGFRVPMPGAAGSGEAEGEGRCFPLHQVPEALLECVG